MSDLEQLTLRLREFATARDWEQFHSPKNLSMALIVEAAELVEHFQWLTEDQSRALSSEKLREVAPWPGDRPSCRPRFRSACLAADG